MKQIRLDKEKSKTNCSSEAPFESSPRFRTRIWIDILKDLKVSLLDWKDSGRFFLYVKSTSWVVVCSSLRRHNISPWLSFHDGTNCCGLPKWLSGKESICLCKRLKRCGFDPWAGKISWSRKWQVAPIFLPRKFQRREMDRGACRATVYGVTKSWIWLSTHTLNCWLAKPICQFIKCCYIYVGGLYVCIFAYIGIYMNLHTCVYMHDIYLLICIYVYYMYICIYTYSIHIYI